jgi:bifunctional enzyme Fae/Hps
MHRKIVNPCVQVALDVPNWEVQQNVLRALPNDSHLIIEAGTPLIKRYGIEIVKKIREYHPDAFILADLKTLDVGKIEVDFTHEAGADAAVVSGLASLDSINSFLAECRVVGITGVIDLMEVENPLEKLQKLTEIPDVILFHRAIDAESTQKDPEARWKLIRQIKNYYAPLLLKNNKDNLWLAVAGGISLTTAPKAIQMGADILVIGRAITEAPDIKQATLDLINLLPK